MQLLTRLQTAAPDMGLPALVPRLWPFFRHTLASVRLAAVRCLTALLGGGSDPNPGLDSDPEHAAEGGPPPLVAPPAMPDAASGLLGVGSRPLDWLGAGVLAPALRLVFQNLVLEGDARVLEASQVAHFYP